MRDLRDLLKAKARAHMPQRQMGKDPPAPIDLVNPVASVPRELLVLRVGGLCRGGSPHQLHLSCKIDHGDYWRSLLVEVGELEEA